MPTIGESLVFEEDIGNSDGQDVAFDTTTGTNRTTALAVGRWGIFCTQACWVLRGGPTVANTTKASNAAHYVPANTIFFFRVSSDDAGSRDQLQVIGDANSGTMRVSRYSRGVD